jgi:hypothetical protein
MILLDIRTASSHAMRTRKKLIILAASTGVPLLCYIAAYLHFVHPMPVHAEGGGGDDVVQPVFRSANPWVIDLFRRAIPLDQELFPGRWNPARFHLPPTSLAGLRKMAPFRARVESVGRTMPYNTGISTLHLGLRLESGHFLKIDEPGATEQMFSIAGSLQDYQLHEFPESWFNARFAK